MSLSNFMAIHPVFVKTFHTKPQPQGSRYGGTTDPHYHRQSRAASMAKRKPHCITTYTKAVKATKKIHQAGKTASQNVAKTDINLIHHQ